MLFFNGLTTKRGGGNLTTKEKVLILHQKKMDEKNMNQYEGIGGGGIPRP